MDRFHRDRMAVIVGARRSPIGTAGKALRHLSAADLGALVLAGLSQDLPDALTDSADLVEVVLGNCMGPGGNVARVAALQAGLPAHVPAVTIDQQCGSGLAAISLAATVVLQEGGMVIAGGVESASTAPWRYWPPVGDQQPQRYTRAPFTPSAMGDPDMGVAADILASEYGVCRARQDAYAARSHARAFASVRAGHFADEIVPLGEVIADERPRDGVTRERLARLRPTFRTEADGGTVTVGNACGVNDGAAAVAVVDAATHAQLQIPGLRIRAVATVGTEPSLPGLGIVPAVTEVLARAGLTLEDVDVIEFNEAFAGQVLACCDALTLDETRLCREGGALALGHPWGASGAVLAVRLFSQLVRRQRGRFGLAAIAVGGGQGVAMVVEACL